MCKWHLSLWRCKHTDEAVTKCFAQKYFEYWKVQERRNAAMGPRLRDWKAENHERLFGSEPRSRHMGKENREGLLGARPRRHDWGVPNREEPLGPLSAYQPGPCHRLERTVEHFEGDCAACQAKGARAMNNPDEHRA